MPSAPTRRTRSLRPWPRPVTDPNKIVDERGMRQVSDAGALQPIVDEVLANCADQAQQYRDGNQKVIGFLVGQCMKASRGKGNPKLFNELLRTSLS